MYNETSDIKTEIIDIAVAIQNFLSSHIVGFFNSLFHVI